MIISITFDQFDIKGRFSSLWRSWWSLDVQSYQCWCTWLLFLWRSYGLLLLFWINCFFYRKFHLFSVQIADAEWVKTMFFDLFRFFLVQLCFKGNKLMSNHLLFLFSACLSELSSYWTFHLPRAKRSWHKGSVIRISDSFWGVDPEELKWLFLLEMVGTVLRLDIILSLFLFLNLIKLLSCPIQYSCFMNNILSTFAGSWFSGQLMEHSHVFLSIV